MPSRPLQSRLPAASVGRLSLYLRELQRLRSGGRRDLKSTELAVLLEVSPAIVRRDLASIGALGRRGVGYDTEELIRSISTALGAETNWAVVLVGVGSLGTALLNYRGLSRQGFQMVAGFDIAASGDPKSVGDVPIYPMERLPQQVRRLQPQLAILAVPPTAAPDVAAQLAEVGISGILNFAQVSLKLPPHVAVVNVDLASEMLRLAFAVSRASDG